MVVLTGEIMTDGVLGAETYFAAAVQSQQEFCLMVQEGHSHLMGDSVTRLELYSLRVGGHRQANFHCIGSVHQFSGPCVPLSDRHLDRHPVTAAIAETHEWRRVVRWFREEWEDSRSMGFGDRHRCARDAFHPCDTIHRS
jgi:hypothetical protein